MNYITLYFGGNSGRPSAIPKAATKAVQDVIDNVSRQLGVVDNYLKTHGSDDYAKNAMPFNSYDRDLDRIGSLMYQSKSRMSSVVSNTSGDAADRARQNIKALDAAQSQVDKMRKRIDRIRKGSK